MNTQLRDSCGTKAEPGAICLRFPPVKLGTTSQSKLNLSSNDWWAKLSSKFPTESTLKFPWGMVALDGANITVIPNVSGKYSFRLPMVDVQDSEGVDVTFQITVYPDPKTIPIVEKPTPEGPYWKKDVDSFLEIFTKMNLYVIGASRRGLSHLADGKFRDDDMCVEKISDTAFVVAVADGAGSAKYSREGSKIAVVATKDFLKTELSNVTFAEFDKTQWAEVLIKSAKNAYDKICSASKERGQIDGGDEEKWIKGFNTTLLVAVVYTVPNGDVNIVSFSVGDGAIVWHSGARTELMSACDSGQYAGETLFLTARSVWRELEASRSDFISKRIKHISIQGSELKAGTLVLMSDGVSDPFFATHDELRSSVEWSKFFAAKGLVDIKRKGTDESVKEELEEWLKFDGGAGHYDDRTIICVFPQQPNDNVLAEEPALAENSDIATDKE